jgi:xanthine dehydrogenase YagR molybdenum-binding subunit
VRLAHPNCVTGLGVLLRCAVRRGLDEDEQTLGRAGAKEIGAVGIVGTAAAVAAVYDAIGIRVRDLPITLEKLITGLEPAG